MVCRDGGLEQWKVAKGRTKKPDIVGSRGTYTKWGRHTQSLGISVIGDGLAKIRGDFTFQNPSHALQQKKR